MIIMQAQYDFNKERAINAIDSKTQLKEFFERFNIEQLEKIDWLLLCKRPVFKSLDLIEKYADYLDWDYLCADRRFTIDFLEKNKAYICWAAVSVFQPINLAFIKKYKDKLLMSHLTRNSYVAESKDFPKIMKIYDEMKDDPINQQKWYDLRQTCFILKDRQNRPSNNTKRMYQASSETTDIITEKFQKELESKKAKTPMVEKSKLKKPEKKKIDTNKLNTITSKRVIVTPKTIETMTKAQLKDILYTRYKIQTKYHTTVPELKDILLNEYIRRRDKKEIQAVKAQATKA